MSGAKQEDDDAGAAADAAALEAKKKRLLPRAIFACGAANFAYFADYYAAITATQALQTQLSKGDMGVAASYTSAFMSLRSVIAVVTVPLMGKLVEDYGRKPVLLLGPLIATCGRLSLTFFPSWSTYGANTICGFFGYSMVGLGGETTLTDLASGAELANALRTYRTTTGLALIVSSPLGALIFKRFGAKACNLLGAASTLFGALIIATVYEETKDLNPKKKSSGGARSAISPFAFLMLFKDATLAKLATVAAMQNLCDFTMDLDGIYLRTDVGLDPNQMGWYYSMRGWSSYYHCSTICGCLTA